MKPSFAAMSVLIRRWWRLTATSVLVVLTAATFHLWPLSADDGTRNLSAGHAPMVLLIGDSYTEGPSTPELSYGCLTASELGWDCEVAAQPGTGYLNGGPGHRFEIDGMTGPTTSFVERLPRLRELYRADIVIVDGGRNDLQFGRDDLMNAVDHTLMQVIESWPDSRIVVIAPWFVNSPVIRPPTFAGHSVGEEFSSFFRSTPGFDDVELIDPGALGWFVGTDAAPYLSADGIHPDSKGVERIADLLTAALIDDGIVSPS